ncbi:Energy-coupling factor transporter transmembrane protein EcfT [Moorella humiferrea]|uniref:Energy-coupling factor transporter transmembrane protein EcfT n=2 Tax=Neomoorella humiferrea TaxID=676965 RepID=A0A2T0ATQ5_9FIRM|nr:Energy-coupling factor transporter transmembrane protein EcfT [Moorella humiferrea]
MIAMADPVPAFYNIRFLDELAAKKSIIHNVHPLMKLLTTGVYLLVTVSFNNYDLSSMLPLIFYPVIIMALADIPAVPIFKRVIPALPFIIGIGIFNPIYDKTPVLVLPWIVVSGGWISFFSILLKGILTITAALILVATTGMPKITSALGIIRIPGVFITQLLLTYRYIAVLDEEAGRMVRAYSLRSAGEKGIKFRDWGPLTGHLLIKSMERAQRVYRSMCCRGFAGEYHTGREKGISAGDLLYLAGWSLAFILIRRYNISEILGWLMMGAKK